MQSFRNILLVTHGEKDKRKVLKEALRLATQNKAQLSVLITCTTLPSKLQNHQEKYEKSLLKDTENNIKKAKSELKLSDTKLPIQVDLLFGDKPVVDIVRHALKHRNDMVIKEIEGEHSEKGFKALDTQLLRKCPCTVYLYRPSHHTATNQRVGVAIDPLEQEPEGQRLAISLLQTAYSLAQYYKKPLDILSCWQLEMEKYLRDQVWVRVSESELDEMVEEERHEHIKQLNSLINTAKLGNEYVLDLIKGDPEAKIPQAVIDKKIDILVMGTVGRTGISGFIIGNTAENILKEINCSLIALKPEGFQCPIAES